MEPKSHLDYTSEVFNACNNCLAYELLELNCLEPAGDHIPVSLEIFFFFLGRSLFENCTYGNSMEASQE